MNCCDEYGDCRQGRDCPVRKRRVRAGGPPPPDLPIEMDEDNKPEPFTAADYFVFAVVIAITGWFLWEVLT